MKSEKDAKNIERRISKFTKSLLVINKTITEMTSSLDHDKILKKYLDGSVRLLEADAGAILNVKYETVNTRMSKNISPDIISLCSFVERIAVPTVIRNIRKDSYVPHELAQAGIKSLLCLPLDLSDNDKTRFLIFSFRMKAFTERNLQEMEILTSAFKSIIQNSMLFEMLTQSHRLWTDTFDAIKDFVFVVDEDMNILKTNRAFAQYASKEPREIIGRKFSDMFNFPVLKDYLIRGRSHMNKEYTMKTDIEGETYLVSIFPITMEAGMDATVFSMKNITEMEKLKDQLYHADKLLSLGHLVSGVAHEINNPLTGILGYTELLQMKTNNETTRKDLDKIYSSAERCKAIIDNLLTYSRQRPPDHSLENINDIIDKTIELRIYWLRTNNILVERDYSDIPFSFLDAQQMQQVILNLLINAEHAVRKVAGVTKGHIKFTTSYEPEKNILIIEIRDNGIGIDDTNRNKIFDPFFTTKSVDEGTGLGLSIAHGIIKGHGGEITVEGKQGEFTKFKIKLPVIRNRSQIQRDDQEGRNAISDR